MPNQIIMPQGNTQTTPAQSDKPTFTPNYWERKYGYTRDGIFYRPSFGIFRNDEPLALDNDFDMAYSYEVASHIAMHLKAVSNDTFTIEPLAWTPIFNHQLNGEVQP